MNGPQRRFRQVPSLLCSNNSLQAKPEMHTLKPMCINVTSFESRDEVADMPSRSEEGVLNSGMPLFSVGFLVSSVRYCLMKISFSVSIAQFTDNRI